MPTVARFAVAWSVALLLGLGVTACSQSRNGNGPPIGTGGDDASADNDGGGGTPDGDAHLTGRVLAPEGTIPIPEALVYVTTSPPEAIPDGVYCDKCIHLTQGTPFTNTNTDGTFDLACPTGDWYLVVQKGAFRRVRRITVTGGVQPVDKAMTTLPSITDKANGDDIPKIAVLLGAWDPIEIVLARLGLQAKITTGGFIPTTRVLSADAKAFAIYGQHDIGEKTPYPSPVTLITQPSEIRKYHIVFIPCSGSSDFGNTPECSGVYNQQNATKTTIESFVRDGGRVYVSDWSYEYVRQIFPGFVQWQGESQTIGSACQSGGGDQGVTRLDTGLDAWMKVMSQNLADVKDAWTVMSGVSPKMDVDSDGNPATVTPKVWVEANGLPATTSFHHGCGRVLYTTYHTQPTGEASKPLEPQALALLYLILEAGVCIDDLIPG